MVEHEHADQPAWQSEDVSNVRDVIELRELGRVPNDASIQAWGDDECGGVHVTWYGWPDGCEWRLERGR